LHNAGRHKVGDKLQLIYDPADPQNPQVEDFWQEYSWPLLGRPKSGCPFSWWEYGRCGKTARRTGRKTVLNI